ncbi:DUF3833 domain-containing protein [Algihabitans albus]|uniref:DUF3833 domain-containing protein n=1 Tax=Algihabitans albus TaxID=2164067 RepID=UPI000E5D693A|nr:DUF3833 domain-containing protein [Algihabitans albus]
MAVWTDTEGRGAGPRRNSAAKTRSKAVARPLLRLEDYFAGHTRAWGLFQDRFGKLKRQFDVEIEGDWDGKRLTLTEDFVYDDGQIEQRIWRIVPDGRNGYRGTADDVIGEARGRVVGNQLHWRYRFSLPLGTKRLLVDFDDRMFLQSDGKLINRARVTKFGLLLGEATIVFAKG